MSNNYNVYVVAPDDRGRLVNISPRDIDGRVVPVLDNLNLDSITHDCNLMSNKELLKDHVFRDLDYWHPMEVMDAEAEYLKYADVYSIPVRDLYVDKPDKIVYVHRNCIPELNGRVLDYVYLDLQLQTSDEFVSDTPGENDLPGLIMMDVYAQLSDQSKENYVPKILSFSQDVDGIKYRLGETIKQWLSLIQYREAVREIDLSRAMALICVDY